MGDNAKTQASAEYKHKNANSVSLLSVSVYVVTLWIFPCSHLVWVVTQILLFMMKSSLW